MGLAGVPLNGELRHQSTATLLATVQFAGVRATRSEELNQRSRDFDLVLSYPQWQGSGRSENLRRGAQAAADVCAGFGPLVSVLDAGEGENQHGINRWTAILEQFRHAQSLLEEH